MTVGIRELKNNLSHFVRRVEAGERISVTAHGRIVAELGPPMAVRDHAHHSRFEALVASGLVTPAADSGDPTASWPDIRLAPGTVRELMDEDRGEA